MRSTWTLAPALVAAAALLGSACIHERMAFKNNCWVKHHKSRWGNTHETVQICEPVPPAPASDAVLNAVQDCTYRAQMAWYNAALQQIRLGHPPPSLADAKDVSAFCVSDANRMALEKVARLGVRADGLERERARLTSDNDKLQDTIVRCVEKQPNAVAEAHATTNSDSNSDSSGRHEASWATDVASEPGQVHIVKTSADPAVVAVPVPVSAAPATTPGGTGTPPAQPATAGGAGTPPGQAALGGGAGTPLAQPPADGIVVDGATLPLPVGPEVRIGTTTRAGPAAPLRRNAKRHGRTPKRNPTQASVKKVSSPPPPEDPCSACPPQPAPEPAPEPVPPPPSSRVQ